MFFSSVFISFFEQIPTNSTLTYEKKCGKILFFLLSFGIMPLKSQGVKLKRFLYIYMLFFCINLQSAEYVDLDLSKAISLAKKQNIQISLAKLDETIKQRELSMVNAKSFGSLNLIQNVFRSNDAGNVFGYALSGREASFRNFGFSDFDDTNPNLLDVQPKDLNYPEARNFYQTKLQYTLPIFTGGKLYNYRKIKRALVRIASLDKRKTIKEIIRQVKKAYADIILLDEFLKNLNTINDNIAILENMTKSMQKEGYAKKVDILEVEAKKANVQRMLHQSTENKKLVYELLSFLVNAQVTSINKESFVAPKPIHIHKEDIKDMIDFKKANEALKLTDASVNLSRSSFLPSVGFVGEYGSSDEEFLGDFKEHDSYTIGVQMKWNIFNGTADLRAYQKAKAQNLKAKEQVELSKKALWLNIVKLKTEIKKIDFDVQSMEAEFLLNKDIYENYIARYKEGLTSIDNVLVKQSNLIETTLKLKELKNKKSDTIFRLNTLLKGED